MKKVLVLLAQGCEEIEALTPVDFLRRAGAEVIVAGIGSDNITGSHEIKIIADCELASVKDKVFDCIVVPGGMPGAKNIAESKLACNILKKHFEDNKLIAGICAAPGVVLAKLGILDNKKACCFPGYENLLINSKVSYEKIVIDGNIITARAMGLALDFSYYICSEIINKQIADNLLSAIIKDKLEI